MSVFKSIQLVGIFLLGLGLGFYIQLLQTRELLAGTISTLRHPTDSYTFINPLLECEFGETLSQEVRPFKTDVEAFVNKKLLEKNASFISVYWRDLNNGPWIGIGEKEPFSPASLLKLPFAIGLLKKSEQEPKFLDTPVPYLGTEEVFKTVTQYFEPRVALQPDSTYPVRQLLEAMVVESDNKATVALTNSVGEVPSIVDEVFRNLGINYDYKKDTPVSVKNYAALFRVLFNGSYLSYGNSEYLLKLLSQSNRDFGLGAGVPKSIPVAHKFGERIFGDEKIQQLHDCGIVYYSTHPYLLCVMTRGDDVQMLNKTIEDTSRFIYEKVKESIN